MVLKRSTNRQDRKQLLNKLQDQGLQPEMLKKLNAVFVQIPNGQLKKWQSNEKIADIALNKPVKLQEVLFPEGDALPVDGKSAASVKEGLRQINALANEQKTADETATIGLISPETVGGTTRGIITYSLAELSEYGVSSTYLAGKPLSGVDLQNRLQETRINTESESYRKFKNLARSHEHWYDAQSVSGTNIKLGLLSIGSGLVGGAVLWAGATGPIGGVLTLAAVGTGVLVGLGFEIAGLGLQYQDAISSPWSDEGQNAELEMDQEKLQDQGITLAMIAESRGIYPDGPGGRDDQNWWNPADWFDGKTGAYTVVSDQYVNHSYRMIELVKQLMDQRSNQYTKK